MEKKSPPPSPASKFKFFYFLPKGITSSKPNPRPKKKKKTVVAAIIPRRDSMRVKYNGSFRSPRLSCIGNIANKANKKEEKKRNIRKNDRKGKECSNEVAASRSDATLILKLLNVFKKKGTEITNPNMRQWCPPPGAVYEKSKPKLGNDKKKELFNWRVQDSSAMAWDRPSSVSNRREKKKKKKRDGAVVVVKDIVLVPKKEINLWKKRMVAPPPPLIV